MTKPVIRKKYLLAPGPVPVPESSRLIAAQSIIHHRTPQFESILKECTDGLKKTFNTTQDVFIMAASGSGAMEAAMANIMSRGEKMLAIVGGKFGERWAKMGEAFGLDVQVMTLEWGSAPDPDDVKKILDADKNIKAVFTQLFETSTTTLFDIKAIAAITRTRDVMLVVDAVSALLATTFEMDAWGVDVAVCGSQKAFMLPPGLAYISLSERAWDRVEKSDLPKFYFNLKAYKKSAAKNSTPYTPAVMLVQQLKETLRIIFERGVEANIQDCVHQMNAVHAAAKALGLKLLSKNPGPPATGILLPDSIDGAKIPKIMRDEYGVTVAGGQEHLKGKIIRIAHMGHVEFTDLVVAITTLEVVLRKLGYDKFELGAGVAALTKELYVV